jgi:hypothetical protein
MSAEFEKLSYAPGLAFLGGAGVRNVNNFQTLVWGFSKILGNIH